MDNNKNLIIAVILSVLILAGFHFIYEAPREARLQQQAVALQKAPLKTEAAPAPPVILADRSTVLGASARAKIDTPQLKGSINLAGARFDDLTLVAYRQTLDQAAPAIVLFSPVGSAPPHVAYFAELSWLSADANLAMPTEDVVWETDGAALSPSSPLTLHWSSPQHLIFTRLIAVDDQFMFTITDTVKNEGSAAVTLFPFGLIRREADPNLPAGYTHDGPLGVIDGALNDYKYKDLVESGKKTSDSDGGWLGFTDKYWLSALIPPVNEKLTAEFSAIDGAAASAKSRMFQADFRGAAEEVQPGASIQHLTHLFAGAKPLSTLDHYGDALGIPHFDRAIDFGRFYWLAEPFLYLLDHLAALLGTFALAILAFTVILKIVTLPLSIKSYRSMAKMKALQPELKRLQERYADDKARQGAEVLELYKREKVNPVSGCVPMIIQIPIFFALYKVLYVGIEMRQAPFYGWISDMSQPDPTSIITLFGLFSSAWIGTTVATLNSLPPMLNLFGGLPALFTTLSHIGAWPIFMGASMFLQQKLSPQPPDKAQARVFMFMPLIFAFTMTQMPAGLVIYWTWSNLLSIGQQWFVMSHTGIRPPKKSK